MYGAIAPIVLKALGSPYEGGLLHVRHLQCSFREQNSLGRIPVDPTEDQLALRRCLEQLDPELGSASLDLDLYSKKGRFLKADTLLLLQWGGDEDPASRKKTAADSSQRKWGKKQEHEHELAEHSLKKGDLPPAPLLPRHWRIVCCDLSIHSITHERLRDPNDITALRQFLLSELNYLRSRGVFSNLNFHVEQGMPENLFADGLETYLTAFKKEDKESARRSTGRAMMWCKPFGRMPAAVSRARAPFSTRLWRLIPTPMGVSGSPRIRRQNRC